MKKKALIIGLIVALCGLIVGGIAVFDNVFPMAEPIKCPGADEIMSVSVSLNDDEEVILSEELFFELLKEISEGEPTRRMSVNDYPTAEMYYKIVIEADRSYCYFVYDENGQVYVELPYEGVYKSDNAIISLLSEMI